MTQTCWFCKKNLEEQTEAVEIPLYRILDTQQGYLYRGLIRQQPYAIKTTYQYDQKKVRIPRCRSCTKTHARAHAVEYSTAIMGLIGILITIILMIVASPVAIKISVSAISGLSTAALLYASAKVPKQILRDVLPLADSEFTHPEMTSLYREGYCRGLSPTDPHRDKMG